MNDDSLTGHAHVYGDDVNTDYIIPSRYKAKSDNLKETARYLMAEYDPDLWERLRPGDFLVGGYNFGCGSSRETAPRIIQLNNVGAVLAKSFGRIFYRNAVNIGLPLVVCDTDGIGMGDLLRLDLEGGCIVNETASTMIRFKPLESFVRDILRAGGAVPYMREQGLLPKI
jgi:3-isopropylmalate/(R)-2-methylmalate dehydratase small subunit